MKISAEFGILNGSISEYVFSDKCKNTDNMLSRLDWDVVTVPYFEVGIEFDIIKYIYADISGRIGIPVNSGNMQDYDWRNSIKAEWLGDSPTELTNYSKHDNHIDRYYTISAKLGGNIPIGKKITLTPYIGYKYDFIDMTSYDGYKIYKEKSFVKEINSGKCISYGHESNAFLLGLNLKLNLIPRVPIETYFQVVPGLGLLNALDLHYERNTAFLDTFKTFFQLDWKFSAFFEINKMNKLGLSTYIQYMPLTKGSTGQGAMGSDGSLPSKFVNLGSEGGTKKFLYSFGLIYQFSL